MKHLFWTAASGACKPRWRRSSWIAYVDHSAKSYQMGASFARVAEFDRVGHYSLDATARGFVLMRCLREPQCLGGGSYFPTSQVIDLARGKPDRGFVYWVQAMGMARRSKAFCWRGVGRVRR